MLSCPLYCKLDSRSVGERTGIILGGRRGLPNVILLELTVPCPCVNFVWGKYSSLFSLGWGEFGSRGSLLRAEHSEPEFGLDVKIGNSEKTELSNGSRREPRSAP